MPLDNNQLPGTEQINNTEIPLVFKAKHVFIIAEALRGGVAGIMFPLLYKVKTSVSNDTELEDDINVSVTIQQVLSVMDLLGAQSERYMAGVNKSIKDGMIAQLTSIMGGADSDIKTAVGQLIQRIMAKDADVVEYVTQKINSGKSFILSI